MSDPQPAAGKLGLEAKLYYGGAGSTATTELTNVKDLTLNLQAGEADITTRGAAGWKVSLAALKEGSLEFTMVWDPSDAGFAAISNAFFSGEAIALAALDGEGGSGLDADFMITQFNRSEPLEDAITVSVTAKPTIDKVAKRKPAWI